MNLLDEATFQNTLDIKKQYAIGDRDVLTVNKERYEQDPYLLQHIMDENLAGTTCQQPIGLIPVFQKVKGA